MTWPHIVVLEARERDTVAVLKTANQRAPHGPAAERADDQNQTGQLRPLLEPEAAW